MKKSSVHSITRFFHRAQHGHVVPPDPRVRCAMRMQSFFFLRRHLPDGWLFFLFQSNETEKRSLHDIQILQPLPQRPDPHLDSFPKRFRWPGASAQIINGNSNQDENHQLPDITKFLSLWLFWQDIFPHPTKRSLIIMASIAVLIEARREKKKEERAQWRGKRSKERLKPARVGHG